MPNRLIKESIHTSESLNSLTDFQFRVWVSLITYVDDYGRGDARPAVIKGTCFPLRKRVTEKDIVGALEALAGAGCVGLYEVDGKPYLYFPSWGSHQNIRNQKSKFPAPDSNCNQLQSTASKCSRNPIQSNPNPNPESESKEDEEDARAREGWERFAVDYERNIGSLPVTEIEREDLTMFFDEFGPDALHEFIAATARKHPDNPHVYFTTICRKNLGKGIRTADAAKAALMDYDRQKGGRRDAGSGGSADGSPRRIFDGQTIV